MYRHRRTSTSIDKPLYFRALVFRSVDRHRRDLIFGGPPVVTQMRCRRCTEAFMPARDGQRRAHITKRVCDQAEPESKRYEIWDDELPGFALRVTANDSRTFIFRYRIKGGGRQSPKKFKALGQYGTITAAEARTHRSYRGQQANQRPRIILIDKCTGNSG